MFLFCEAKQKGNFPEYLTSPLCSSLAGHIVTQTSKENCNVVMLLHWSLTGHSFNYSTKDLLMFLKDQGLKLAVETRAISTFKKDLVVFLCFWWYFSYCGKAASTCELLLLVMSHVLQLAVHAMLTLKSSFCGHCCS